MSTREPVHPAEKAARALERAAALCSEAVMALASRRGTIAFQDAAFREEARCRLLAERLRRVTK